jgi:hypothetical protein
MECILRIYFDDAIAPHDLPVDSALTDLAGHSIAPGKCSAIEGHVPSAAPEIHRRPHRDLDRHKLA